MEKKRKRLDETITEHEVVKKSKTLFSGKAELLQTTAIPVQKNNIKTREVKKEHKDFYIKNIGELSTTATPVPKKSSNKKMELSQMLSQMFGMSMSQEENITKKEMLYENYGITESESSSLWNDAVKEYKEAYLQVKNLDLKPIRNLLHTVSTDSRLVKTENGKSLQKEAVNSIYKFAETRFKILKTAPTPEKITDNTDIVELRHSLVSLVFFAENISKNIKDEVDRTIQNSKPLKGDMFGEGASKKLHQEAKEGINKNNLEFIENEFFEKPSVQISKSAGILFTTTSSELDSEIFKIAKENQTDSSKMDIDMPDVRQDVLVQFETSSKQSPHLVQDLVYNYTSAYNDAMAVDKKELLKIRQSLLMDKSLTQSRNGKIVKNELLSKLDHLAKDINEISNNVVHPLQINKTNFACEDISALNKIHFDYENVKELYDEAKILSRNNSRESRLDMYS